MTLLPNNKEVGLKDGSIPGPNAPSFNYDYVEASYPNSTTEVFTFKLGGVGGSISATVTIIYTSASKNDLDTVEWT